MRTEIMTARTVGGEASTALMNARNARQRDRANRRTIASVIRRLRLLRRAAMFARGWEGEAMVYNYNRKEGRGAVWSIPRARGTEERMEPDDLLCSRNARPQKALVGRAQWKINQPPSLERERASLEW